MEIPLQSPASGSLPPVRTREVVAWALCDWANSAYSTLLITIVVSYLQAFVLPGDAGILAYGWGLGISMFLSALLSPVLGAMADARANKRTWLLCTSFTGAACSIGMGLIPSHWPWAFMALFFLASLAFELSFSFYNGFLPELADDDSMNRLSGWGYAAGYFGGGLALAVAIAVLSIGSRYGLETVTGLRIGLVIMGVWWGLFTIPAAIFLRDRNPPRGYALGFTSTARVAIGEVLRTLGSIRSYSVLALFLLGFLLYNEGIQTVMSQASVFAREVLKMTPGELGMVVLMIQFVATPAAIGVGWLGDRIGPKTTLFLCLIVWCGLLIAAFFTTTKSQFWVLGVVLALVMGGTQSISRAIMGSMTPTAKTAEFFGFFNLSCRATSMFGPILFAQMFVWTGSANVAILSLLVFIVAGMLIVSRVNLGRGMEQARTG